LFEDILRKNEQEISLENETPSLVCGYCVHYDTEAGVVKMGMGVCMLIMRYRLFMQKACAKYIEVD
jgi:hypothetical protein